MIQKLVKHGDSYALIIDRTVLDRLDITPDTLLEVTTDGRKLIVETNVETNDEFKTSLDKVNDRFGNVLKKLA